MPTYTEPLAGEMVWGLGSGVWGLGVLVSGSGLTIRKGQIATLKLDGFVGPDITLENPEP